MLTNDDLKQIREEMALVFVTRKSCDERNDEVERRLSRGEVHFARIDENLKIIKWLITAIGGGIITMLIKMFFGM